MKSVAVCLYDSIRQAQRNLLDWMVRHHPSLHLDERAEFFTSLFEKDIPPSSRILDIGGSWGFYHEPLVKRGHSHAVLDVVRPSYQKAPVVIYDPGDAIPFPDKSFDVSLFITVLHHIDDSAGVLREAMRVTRKKIIVVEDVYHHALGRFWTEWRDRIYNFEYFGHPCRFKKSGEWIELFESLGMKLERHENVYTWLSGMRILNGVFVFTVNS